EEARDLRLLGAHQFERALKREAPALIAVRNIAQVIEAEPKRTELIGAILDEGRALGTDDAAFFLCVLFRILCERRHRPSGQHQRNRHAYPHHHAFFTSSSNNASRSMSHVRLTTHASPILSRRSRPDNSRLRCWRAASRPQP